MKKRSTGYNTGLPQVTVTCLLECLCFYQSSVLVDSLVLLNRQLRQARKRYRKFSDQIGVWKNEQSQ